MNKDIIYEYEPLWGKWKVDKLLGKGSIGKVYLISKNIYNKKYYSAVKVITIPSKEQYEAYINTIDNSENVTSKEFFKEIKDNIITEIDLLYNLKAHSNIISYEDHFIKEDEKSWHIFIKMEYAQSLKDYLKNNILNQDTVIKLGLNICDALILCHKKT